MTEEQKIIMFCGIAVALALIIFLIARLIRKNLYEYSEYTGKMELKSKIQADSERLAKIYRENQRKKAKESKKKQQANINETENSICTMYLVESPKEWEQLDTMKKHSIRMKETRMRIGELSKSHPEGRLDNNLDMYKARVFRMLRKAKGKERISKHEVIRDFVIGFETEIGQLHFPVGERMFNDVEIGQEGTLIIAYGEYVNFEPDPKIEDLFK